VGTASAGLGHMRLLISPPMLRWSSEKPKSKTKRRSDFS
jgi:hypothetical protein